MNTLLDRVHQARKNDKGFTLIELLMVIVILGVLAGIVVFAVNGINDRGEESACKADVKSVEVAIEANYAQTGSYPADEAAAEAAVVPEFLHSWPATVNYAAVGTNFTVTGTVPGC
ncbi:type II secretion system protein [Actinokineospora xionganensis]|uniref:Prepilin-type N-terminal cleavage/methylation domain-containing protein n=1 Tax=Actinokineospora xionganensis TaxID=2684470 RepID=A0ABR7KZ30_9PSEU|nr:prepilin-type N-terminal cleavage/methylation domain-containing protein [Actinokineospora xionganensis]MBC6445681.1 prepilin-type N-terminal cleavage/methylation domain-containing protein [Actinokineospora xionganensis]